jgi:hypothetical protein
MFRARNRIGKISTHAAQKLPLAPVRARGISGQSRATGVRGVGTVRTVDTNKPRAQDLCARINGSLGWRGADPEYRDAYTGSIVLTERAAEVIARLAEQHGLSTKVDTARRIRPGSPPAELGTRVPGPSLLLAGPGTDFARYATRAGRASSYDWRVYPKSPNG